MFLALLCCQCSSTPEKVETATTTETNTIFTNFYVRYLQSEQQLKGQVTFAQGKDVQDTKPVNMKKVNFMESGMNKKDVAGKFSRYIYQAPTPNAMTNFNFNYTDNSGKSYQQELEMKPLENFSIKDGYSKSKGMILQLEGESAHLTADESLVLLFSDEKNKVTTLEVGGPSTNPAINFTGSQLGDLSLGKNKLYIVKKQNRRFQKDNYDMTSTIEFYSSTIELDMME